MRLLLTTIILTMLAQPALSLTTRDLLDNCRPYVDNDFSMAGLSEKEYPAAVLCLGFMSGVMHTANTICSHSKSDNDKFLYGTSLSNTNDLLMEFFEVMSGVSDSAFLDTRPVPFIWLANTCKE